MPQYLSELITWTAIGARTTESQTHREMASGLSTPVGFKNGTDGALATSINALESVRHPHHFLGITQQGQSAVFRTRGNAHAHLVLRGGGGRVNYDAVSIALAERQLAQANLPTNIVVDCSHGNSNKDPGVQPLVAENCVTQILDGNRSIVGSHAGEPLEGGQSAHPEGPEHAGIRGIDHRSLHGLAEQRDAALEAARGVAEPPALARAFSARPLGPFPGRNTGARRAAARGRVAVDQQRALGEREMGNVREAVAVGGHRRVRDNPRAAARGSAPSPSPCRLGVRNAPSSRSPSQRTSVHTVRSKPSTRPMRGT